MPSMPDFSALYRCPPKQKRPARGREPTEKALVTGWDVEGSAHPGFDPAASAFCCPKDALYSVSVQVIPSDGRAPISSDILQQSRRNVDYTVMLAYPKWNQSGDADKTLIAGDESLEEEYMDVGPRSFGEILHLRKGTRISIWAMPSGVGDSLRLKVQMLIRKRKREPEVEISEKERLKREKKRRREERKLMAAAKPANGAHAPNGEEQSKGEHSKEPSVPSVQRNSAKRKMSVPGASGQPETPDRGAQKDPTKCRQDSESDDERDNDAWSAGFSSDDSAVEDANAPIEVGRIAKRLRSASTDEPKVLA